MLVTLAAAGRNPTDILIPTQAGTEGSGGGDDEDDDVAGGGSATSGGTFQAMADGGDGKSHEESADQGWVSWMIGGMADGLRKADQMGGAAMSFLLTGSAKTGEYGSFVGMAVQFDLGVLQGEANSVNGVQDAVIGLANLAGKGANTAAGHTVVLEFASPDWSRDRIVFEGETAHNVSKFLGGNGVITLATAGAGSAGAAGSGARVLQVTGLVAGRRHYDGSTGRTDRHPGGGRRDGRHGQHRWCGRRVGRTKSPICRWPVDLRAGELLQTLPMLRWLTLQRP